MVLNRPARALSETIWPGEDSLLPRLVIHCVQTRHAPRKQTTNGNVTVRKTAEKLAAAAELLRDSEGERNSWMKEYEAVRCQSSSRRKR